MKIKVCPGGKPPGRDTMGMERIKMMQPNKLIDLCSLGYKLA